MQNQEHSTLVPFGTDVGVGPSYDRKAALQD